MKTKLNIFLAKEGKSKEMLIKQINDDSLHQVEVTNGTFYYKEAVDKIPVWVESLFDDELQGESIANKTIQAVYLSETEVVAGQPRFFAITFGLGRNILNLDNFEENFGFITTLNLVNENDLRSLDTDSLGSGSKKHFIQIGHSSKLKDFGIDLEKDLVKNISGKLSDVEGVGDAKSICGKQSVLLSSNVTLADLPEFFRTLYRHFQSRNYLERFPGMNHAKIIKDKSRIEELDNHVLRIFNGELEEESNIELAIPELKLNHEIGSFRYASSENPHSELDLNELREALQSVLRGRQVTIRTLKSNYIRMLSDDGTQIDKWKIYNCISADLAEREKQYVLNEGKWYSFDIDYAQTVKDFYNSLEISETLFDDYRPATHYNETENQYNDRISRNNDQFEKVDCECITPFDQTPIEICDIYDKATDSFIHVKRNEGSSLLSHLFLQGSVSAELLRNKSVREDLLRRVSNLSQNISLDYFNPETYTIVYAIIDRSKATRTRHIGDRPRIPFFSKISIRQVVNSLTGLGYTIKLKRIKWSEA